MVDNNVDLTGMDVYNKRNGLKGTVEVDYGSYVVVCSGELVFNVTKTMLERHYRIDEASKKPLEQPSPKATSVTRLKDGGPGAGAAMSAILIDMLKQNGLAHLLEIIYRDEKLKKFTVKYAGYNILECTEANRRLTVYANPNALTPRTTSYADRIVPRSWKWTLSVQYVFCEDTKFTRFLMRSIVIDSLFFRKDGKE